MTPAPATPIPAATLVLMRRRADGPPDVLMLERAGSMRFAAGAMVFPGGRLEPGDTALAVAAGADAVEGGARVAAIRETIEEVGIAVGLAPAPDAATIQRLRTGLAGGGDFAMLLGDEGLALDLSALVPFARWCPKGFERRVFDTFFFVADAPDSVVATADGGESVRVMWDTARNFLDEADAGRHHVIFPTRRNLERLAGLASLAAARDHLAAFPPATISPWIEERDGERWLCIPPGMGYPVTAERLATAMRG